MLSPEAEKLFHAGLHETLKALAHVDSRCVVQVDEVAFVGMLKELVHLRWQVRELQERGTELVMENRELRRTASTVAPMIWEEP